MNSTVNKFDLVTYILELNKREKDTFFFKLRWNMKKKSTYQVSKFQIINIEGMFPEYTKIKLEINNENTER